MKLEYAGISKENLKSGISLSAITNSTRSRIIKTIFNKPWQNHMPNNNTFNHNIIFKTPL